MIASGQALAQDAATSLNPGNRPETPSMLPDASKATTKKVKHRKGIFSPAGNSGFQKANVKHTARYEFYERIEQAAKDKQRVLKKLSKAQYSDPRYFGHKRIPKRHSPKKMRYCGECGIRH
ncbi:MAG TPA: hypothetical protein VK508_17190 [Cyclobacteriaceae bacterium]|nr:hypothetical protein [Cyclobacteriaceae bacterium]